MSAQGLGSSCTCWLACVTGERMNAVIVFLCSTHAFTLLLAIAFAHVLLCTSRQHGKGFSVMVAAHPLPTSRKLDSSVPLRFLRLLNFLSVKHRLPDRKRAPPWAGMCNVQLSQQRALRIHHLAFRRRGQPTLERPPQAGLLRRPHRRPLLCQPSRIRSDDLVPSQ